MKPATPKHPRHDSACPFCGEPFMAARFMGGRIGSYACARCSGKFSLIGDNYFDQSARRLPAWVGEPLPGGA